MKKGLLDYQSVYMIMLIFLVGSSILGLYFIKEYTGHVFNEISSDAGSISAILVDDRRATAYWGGVFGLVFSQAGFDEEQTATLTAGEIITSTFVFTCQDPAKQINEIYASMNSSFNFSNVTAGNTLMVDRDLLNLEEDTRERANNSFIYNESVILGEINISGIPAIYTYSNDAFNDTLFFTGIINASGQLGFVIKVFASSTQSFKGTLVDYQAMLPLRNTSTRWYFFADPYDECPAGFGSGQLGDAIITGFVLESGTMNPIANATISAGGNISYTDLSGAFNITVPGDRVHSLIGLKEGYITNITNVNTTIGVTTTQNLTLAHFPGYVNANSTISGYVKDNSTGLPIANAIVGVEGLITESNGSGNYSITIPAGPHIIASIKIGYNNFVGNFTINALQNLSFIINMTEAPPSGAQVLNGTLVNNGTVQGYATDSQGGAALSGVTVTVAGSSNITNGAGFYNLSALAGTTNLVAVRSGYESYFSEVNVTEYNITVHNFSMDAVTAVTGVANGSVAGTVTSTSGSPLSGVAVSVAGKTNLTDSAGFYNISSVPEGTHNLVAVRSGFENYFSEINITRGNTTIHDFEMETTIEAGLGAGSGSGQGAGSGAGQGAGLGAGRGRGTGIPAQVQQPTQVIEYDVSVKRIIKKLRVGNFITVPIKISNFKEDTIDVRLSFEGDVGELSRLDRERIIIDGGSNTEITLTLLGNLEPGVYEGNLVVSGDINERIPMYILIMDRERLSIESLIIKINPVKRKLPAGDDFKYTVDLQNMLSEEKYKVSLTYSVEGINTNRSIFLEKEDVVILTSFTLLKTFKIPRDFVVGDYALKVKADFLDETVEQSTIFTVVIPFYKYRLFNLIPMWIIFLAIGSLTLGTLGYLYIKKKQSAKKRYKIELDLNALPKQGPRTAYVGQVAESKTRTFFDLDLFQVHTVVAGSSGSGKSVVAQVLVEEALQKGVAVVVFDPTAQWTGFLRRLEDKKLLALYPTFGLKKTEARPFNGNVHQVIDGRQLLEFSRTFKQGEINVYVTSKLETKDVETLVSNTIKEIFHAHLPESRELKYLLIYDGIHSLLPKFGGSGSVFVQIERATREFRKWGVGLILVSQVLSDFPPEVMANINTEIQLRTRDENDLNRAKEKYGEQILQSMVKAAAATGVVQNSSYNKGKPYFVTFRPPYHGILRITDEELDNYNKYNAEMEDIEYQLEQLEREGCDVFDLRLELKLSMDKVKSGNFNMVAIYLEGLKPRIKAQWDKISKVPIKREVKYYKEGELEGELEKAKEKRKGKEEERKEEARKEGIKNDENNDAIKKAKEARSKATDEAKASTQTQGPISASEQQMVELYSQIKELIDINKKTEATALYAKVQEIYKNTPKEDKSKVLDRAKDIQKLLAQQVVEVKPK